MDNKEREGKGETTPADSNGVMFGTQTQGQSEPGQADVGEARAEVFYRFGITV